MVTHTLILMGVWRAVGKNANISDATRAIFDLIRDEMPIREILVRHVDIAQSDIETAAGSSADGRAFEAAGRIGLTPKQVSKLNAWVKRPIVIEFRDGQISETDLSAVVPREAEGRGLAMPLDAGGGRFGALLLFARDGTWFDDKQLTLAEGLREPFGAAMENDLRFRELGTLREAAEADRESLLNRLGRRDLADTVIGGEGGMRSVMERVEMVSRSDVPVLILGETGTGKELVSRAIHTRSARHAGPFIRVNCGAIPSELIDSQLFGHERGSFTGAVDTHKGWFERADRGTLFLDEIGELPLPAQVRLLRVLQDGLVERVGSHKSISVDVRVVAATHRDLAGMVREGRFREDLWYRINVFPILIPPLRERREDIASLARHFAERAATRFGLSTVMPTADDIHQLMAYAWPGNVRELGTVIDRAALLGNGKRLEVGTALGTGYSQSTPATAKIAASVDGTGMGGPDLRSDRAVNQRGLDALDDAMRGHIEKALAACHGRVEGPFGAAKVLDINPRTLRSRMRKLGVNWKAFRG